MTASLSELREAIRQTTHTDEEAAVGELVRRAETGLDPERRARVLGNARGLVTRCREQADEAGTLDAFLQEFGLSNPEGVALMCLAEALLRVPDDETADRLIAEKIRSGDWASHLGKSDSLFVNGSVWGLMLTGRLVTLPPETEQHTDAWMKRLVSRIGEPVVRTAVVQAMRILGRQYVLGRTIGEALRRSRGPEDARFSFDMLGEGARTWRDAERHLDAYHQAIEAVGAAADGDDPVVNDGISVKLSALHPRYEFARARAVRAELLPRLLDLAAQARAAHLGFSIDAEEAARLDLSLELFEELARSPRLADWDGLGFVLQAYQKRAPAVADWLVALAAQTGRRLMVRLVKGAYWDYEIKHAQERGLADYPVFTRKTSTDLCYEICAARLVAEPAHIYPQFATHNATTACQVLELVQGGDFELQRLHGMGELLYEELSREAGGRRVPVRIYAPVGSHQDLLPYLVRRLLENGANSSFVNRFLDNETPVDVLISDPLAAVRAEPSIRHSRIPKPEDVYRGAGEPRLNAAGVDLDDPLAWQALKQGISESATSTFTAAPVVAGREASDGKAREVRSPADRDVVVGRVIDATPDDVNRALEATGSAQSGWDALGGARRADILDRAADLLESERTDFMHLIGSEAARTVADALSEVREAVDFLRYYAMQARRTFAGAASLPGPTGERNELSLHGRGTFACISPWNFPLAIFTGQLSAALAAGNCVVAKPAEQTPLTAALAVRLLHRAGVPPDVLHLLPGAGPALGGALAADERVNGIAFTGSTATAQAINRRLAERDGPIVPLIAETGGQNVMVTDSTALPEQLVDDVIDSSFRSAGQRCSALRVLYLQEDIADKVLEMLAGAMATLAIGDPRELVTDVGPIIDETARQRLQTHVDRMEREARQVARCKLPPECARGSFLAPQVFEIESIRVLTGEVFGPILHVIRYGADHIERVIDEINATGYGLTLGVHSRIENFAREIFDRTRVGNTYVNRNMVGAVVGVQPFGGQGLSGTGPKAGGPHYLARFATEKTYTDNITARGGNAELFELDD
jgi:RHH-type proline utilization regulon transcriptional repressor/proline dehydrogenase/delta 1-pyrroline-5-carboxylate dehydrogenase